MGFFRNIFGPGSKPDAAPAELPRLTRRSTGFHQFVRVILRPDGQTVLDLGPTSAANITYLTGLGHRTYNEDILAAANSGRFALPGAEPDGPRFDVERFLAEDLQYAPETFDAVIMWDVCDYLPEEMVKPTVERIYRIAKPEAALLAFFHSREAGADAPHYRYHIKDENTLELQTGAPFPLQRTFQNRHIEKLFQNFTAIKFFLGKENISEVLLVR
ncbi:MAG: class I SAM-dependent methyltransferase [Acidobacteriota bacterium]|nr:class I SAM-dependent methyltransferase [Acidobacteriota bacterium]